jgi:hypothetical protein
MLTCIMKAGTIVKPDVRQVFVLPMQLAVAWCVYDWYC